jgi:uncharacterized radical SAM superfamily protein
MQGPGLVRKAHEEMLDRVQGVQFPMTILEPFKDWAAVKAADLDALIESAREMSWNNIGKDLQCFIPGRMMYMREQGKYPTISITGSGCALNCDHCQTKILGTMIAATTPENLYETCIRMNERDNIGVLISGGSKKDGSLPWEGFLETIAKVKEDTNLKITVHTGLIDKETALTLRKAGVDEFLIDVIGSKETMHQVYHLDTDFSRMEASLEALEATGAPLVPHVVFGLHYGEIRGEMEALEMVARHNPYVFVIVVLIPIKDSPMKEVAPPDPADVARFIAAARARMPTVPISLSCARPTGRYRDELDVLAVETGINRIAMPSEMAVDRAKELGLNVEFFKTCCSKSY